MPAQNFLDLFWNLHYDHSMMQVVMADLYERAYMIQSAPFMTQPLPMMIPLHKWWEIPVYWFSGKMYDWIAGSLLLPCPSKLSLLQSGQFQVDVDAPATAEACILVGMLILFRVATYYALNRKTKFKQS